jgi:alkylhydroperoxidase/carboxymuconolactone decarboxylase family protein YurZ
MIDASTEALDRLLIQELISSYGALYDDGHLDEFETLFAEDAVMHISPDPGFFPLPVVGRAAISEAMRGRHAVVSAEATRRHVTTNTIFHSLTADTAMTSSFLTVLSTPHGGASELRGTGVYRDRLVKQGGRWLFAERRLTLDGLKPDTEAARPAAEPASSVAAGPSQSAATGAVEEEIVTEIGAELPDAISVYTRLDPEMFRAYRAFRSELLDTGIISRKDKMLMVLALLTATKQGDAMDMYARIARKEGATAQEVREACRVGILFSGGPGIVAASQAVVDHGAE